jgi:hypothetical protein
MRGRFIDGSRRYEGMSMRALGMGFVISALASVLGATPASASTGWTVTPGGVSEAVGTTGIGFITVQSAGWGQVDLACDTVNTPLDTFSSTDNLVGQVYDVLLDDCAAAFGMSLSVVERGSLPWSLHALDYNASVVSGEIRDVFATFVGGNCWAEVEGVLPVTYMNGTNELALVPVFTVEVTFVAPGADCNGLFSVGDQLAYDAAFSVSPSQEILPV